jgi:hypothetical protein
MITARMKLYLKHSIANFFYAVDVQNQQVELCSTVGGRERIERYEGISGALQTGNVLITEEEYSNAKSFTLRQLGLATQPEKTNPMSYITDFLFSPLN